MHQPKTYFIFKPVVYKPDDLIQLGQVITDPRKPFQRLAKPLPLVDLLAPRSAPQVEWSATNTTTGEVSASIFSHAIKMKAGVSVGTSTSETETWEAAILDTRFFEISEDPTYVSKTAKVPAVEAWLREFRHQGKTVYMITGLKIAKRPGKVTFDSSNTSSMAAELETVVDPEGVVSIGAAGKMETTDKTASEATPEGEYIFGYRLRKLRVMWRDLKLRGDMEGGELYGHQSQQAHSGVDAEREYQDSDFEMGTLLLEEGDFGQTLPARDRKLEALDEDDGTLCTVIPVSAPNF